MRGGNIAGKGLVIGAKGSKIQQKGKNSSRQIKATGGNVKRE